MFNISNEFNLAVENIQKKHAELIQKIETEDMRVPTAITELINCFDRQFNILFKTNRDALLNVRATDENLEKLKMGFLNLQNALYAVEMNPSQTLWENFYIYRKFFITEFKKKLKAEKKFSPKLEPDQKLKELAQRVLTLEKLLIELKAKDVSKTLSP